MDPPPHKMDQHLSGERWGDRPWACPPAEIPYKRKGGPALPAVSPQLGQRAEEISWTVSPRSPAPAPQRGLQAELVNAPKMRELRKGQDGTKLSPCFPTSREPPPAPAPTGWGRAGGHGPAPLVPCPLFALLDLGVRRVGRWSCLTQRACVPVRVCMCVCVCVCLSV